MDNFPIRRGIGLSRTQHPNIPPPNFYREPHRLPQSINRTLPPNLTATNRLPHFQIELNQPNPAKTHHKAPSGNILNVFAEKTPLTEAVNFPQMHRQTAVPTYPVDNNAFKIPAFLPTPLGKDQTQQQLFASDPKAEKKAFQFNPILEDNTVIKDTVTLENKSILQIESIITSPRQPKVQHQSHSNSNHDFKMQQQTILNEKMQQITTAFKLEAATREKVWSDRLENLEKENQSLKEQLRIKDTDKSAQHIQAQSQALRQEINQKSTLIKQSQQKTRQIEQQLKSKLASVEYELRLLKGNKNRLEIQIDSNKKLVKSQRQKNEKAKQQMNKLIFFQDDLIHAKDYQKLKDQLEYVLLQNTKLFQEHQQYIVQVGQQRKLTEDNINQLQTELKKLKIEYGEYRDKISQVLQGGDDKMIILKLQAEINFLKKKNEDLSEQLYTREKQLEQALLDIKELNSKDNQKQESSRNVLDEFNVRQIQETVSMYETRLQDLNENLARKQRETEKQKKTIELLTSELRHVREDKHINSMKGKSNEDSLKNQVEILQKGHQTELELKNKKICNLEDCIQRKSKEIAEKDKFIKDFLLSRIKQLESSSPQELFTSIKQYFQPQQALKV